VQTVTPVFHYHIPETRSFPHQHPSTYTTDHGSPTPHHTRSIRSISAVYNLLPFSAIRACDSLCCVPPFRQMQRQSTRADQLSQFHFRGQPRNLVAAETTPNCHFYPTFHSFRFFPSGTSSNIPDTSARSLQSVHPYSSIPFHFMCRDMRAALHAYSSEYVIWRTTMNGDRKKKQALGTMNVNVSDVSIYVTLFWVCHSSAPHSQPSLHHVLEDPPSDTNMCSPAIQPLSPGAEDIERRGCCALSHVSENFTNLSQCIEALGLSVKSPKVSLSYPSNLLLTPRVCNAPYLFSICNTWRPPVRRQQHVTLHDTRNAGGGSYTVLGRFSSYWAAEGVAGVPRYVTEQKGMQGKNRHERLQVNRTRIVRLDLNFGFLSPSPALPLEIV